MLTNVKLSNFKAIKDKSLNLSLINIITGVNSSGKSSLLQSILLIKQINNYQKTINLNGDYVSVGTVDDILHQFNDDSNIKVIFCVDDKRNYEYCIYNADEYTNSDAPPVVTTDHKTFRLSTLRDKIFYLAAERMGGEFVYKISSAIDQIGVKGENTVSYLDSHRGSEVAFALVHKSLIKNVDSKPTYNRDLFSNVNAWMNEISPGIILDFNADKSTRSASMEASYFSASLFGGVTPKNFGYGISYCLPIITMILTSKKGSILLIENPEAHIHPSGQTQLGLFCSLAVKSGIQLIIETHSDHFFNGVRLALNEGLISVNDVRSYYFSKNLEGDKSSQKITTNIELVELHENGKIKNAPVGFFDEWQNSLFKLL